MPINGLSGRVQAADLTQGVEAAISAAPSPLKASNQARTEAELARISNAAKDMREQIEAMKRDASRPNLSPQMIEVLKRAREEASNVMRQDQARYTKMRELEAQMSTVYPGVR